MPLTSYPRGELRERRIFFQFSRGEIKAESAMKKLKVLYFSDLCAYCLGHAIPLPRLTRKQCEELADAASDFQRFSAALRCAKRSRLSRPRNSDSVSPKRKRSTTNRRPQ